MTDTPLCLETPDQLRAGQEAARAVVWSVFGGFALTILIVWFAGIALPRIAADVRDADQTGRAAW